MGWMIYVLVAVLVSGVVGWHLSRFQHAGEVAVATMIGLGMGLLNGFVVGYGASAATANLFWGNLVGVLLGLVLGIYYGRAGGLLGSIDGGLGGVTGGALGAVVGFTIHGNDEAQLWTGVLFGAIYVLGMVGLVVLLEQNTPEYAGYHFLAPLFLGRSYAAEALDADEGAEPEPEPEPEPTVVARPAGKRPPPRPAPAPTSAAVSTPPPAATSTPPAPGAPAGAAPTPQADAAPAKPRRLVDYYAFLGVHPRASADEIWDAYDARMEDADDTTARRAEQALAILTDPEQRRTYDRALADNRAALAAAQAASPGAPGAQSSGTPPRKSGGTR